MEELETSSEDDPLPKQIKTVGIIYNLKKGKKNVKVTDEEAEYDNINTIYAIKNELEAGGFKVELLEADDNLSQKLHNTKIDIAFNIAEGIKGRGREAQVPAVLNMHNIPFTGSDETTLCIALDKAITKRLLGTYGVRSPKYLVISKDIDWNNVDMKYPAIIKPNAEGSSKGISDISIVKSKEELKNLVTKNIELYDQSMLAEEYIEGREFTVGIIGNGKQLQVFRPMEIVYDKTTQENYHVYSYTVKQEYKKYVHYECPAKISEEQEKEMMDISEKIYNILECRDFSRIDFRLSENGEINFIEVNPLPGLAPEYSDYPMLAEFCGTKYGDLVRKILYTSAERQGFQAGGVN